MDTKISIPENSSDIIRETYESLIKTMTGVATAEKKDLILSVSRVLQNIRATNLLGLLKNEWEYWKEKGKIKEDYHQTEQHLNCLHELLEFLENDIPDELRFNTLKKILLVAASESLSDRNDILPQQFLAISKRLSSGEMMVLFAAYKLAKECDFNYPSSNVWKKDISANSPLKFTALVELHEKNLIELKLIGAPSFFTKQCRLSDLGIEFCRYIEAYETIQP